MLQTLNCFTSYILRSKASRHPLKRQAACFLIPNYTHSCKGVGCSGETRLSCQKFRNNEVRLQLHALAYNLGNFMRTLALPKAVEHWSLTTLRA